MERKEKKGSASTDHLIGLTEDLAEDKREWVMRFGLIWSITVNLILCMYKNVTNSWSLMQGFYMPFAGLSLRWSWKL